MCALAGACLGNLLRGVHSSRSGASFMPDGVAVDISGYEAEDSGDEDLRELAKATAAGKGIVELRQLFDTLDVDHDGKVTGQEWGKKVKENQTLLAKYFGGSTLKEIGSAFKRIDTDGNASLSWDEFVAAAGLELPDNDPSVRYPAARSSPPQVPPLNIARAQAHMGGVDY